MITTLILSTDFVSCAESWLVFYYFFCIQVEGATSPNFHGCVEMAEDRVAMVMEFIGDEQTGETMALGKVLYTGIPALTRRDWWKVAKDLVPGYPVRPRPGIPPEWPKRGQRAVVEVGW